MAMARHSLVRNQLLNFKMVNQESSWIGNNLMIRLISISFSFFTIFFLPLSASSIIVGSSHSIKHIKEAVALAGERDTIFIDGGLYKEGNITITKSLKIIGLNQPVIDGENKFEIFTVSAENF